MYVYLGGKRLKLDPTQSLGSGGEADVFDLGAGRALKVFKSSDHADYQGLPHEQAAAEARLDLHQRKLPAFPTGLPSEVVVPEQLATDRSGGRIVGYAMRLVADAQPLRRYGDPGFRRAGVSNNSVATLFLALHRATTALHAAGVVVGDYSDLNVLVTAGGEGRFIDADSFQFGSFPCSVFTERFVDPLLCDEAASAPRLARPYTADADWYAFAVLLMQSLVLVGPYGGIYRPADPARRIPHGARPLHRITVFHPEVQYPKPAVNYRVLPDELLEHFQRVFTRDQRGPFPLRLLEDLRFQVCSRCALDHARVTCPMCAPHVAAGQRPVVTVRGAVHCREVFATGGTILCACIERGELRFLYHEAGAYRREDGAVVLRGGLDPGLRFRILGAATLVGRGSEFVVLSEGRTQARWSCDAGGSDPAFDTNGRHRYWISAGQLFREAPSPLGNPIDPTEPIETIGSVLAGQTRIWVGSSFGLGFYRAMNLSVAFTFDAERRGINDTLSVPPLRGHLVEATCALDDQRAWLLLALHSGGRTKHLCLVYSKDGILEATADADPGDGSWLGTLRGKHATQGMLLAATDAGLQRLEVSGGAVRQTREFPDTEPFVDSDCQLLAGANGLYVVGQRRIAALRMN